jgi:outer membrane murein-binding lipoprotein Lpp
MTASHVRITLAAVLLAGLCGTAPQNPMDVLLDQVADLRRTVEELRVELAQARLDEAAAQRKLDEMRQFIHDHEAYGRDFAQYQSLREIAEKASRRHQAEAASRQRQAERAARREAAGTQRVRQEAESQRAQRYRDAGLTPLGLDVYVGAAAFNYSTIDGIPARVDWNGLTGRFIRLYQPSSRVDFSTMTISGSILNAAASVRDVGVAIIFFDEAGNQVGGQTIQVNNARPDVPYPFTATVTMALDRPFASSTTYVLYADEPG